MRKQILFTDLGVKPYKEVWEFQENLLQKNVAIKSAALKSAHALDETYRNGAFTVLDNSYLTNTIESTKNYLLFVEHPPVYTLGKNGNQSNLLLTEYQVNQRGAEFFHINRGGDITFHGPQQLVVYPVFDLDDFKPDLGWYLRSLEEVIILTLKDYGLHGERSKGETGVWLDAAYPQNARKICAMGIRCSRWITMHGLALNVNPDLSYFDNIIPCGIKNKKVTSLERELDKKINMYDVKQKVLKNFRIIFNADITENELAI